MDLSPKTPPAKSLTFNYLATADVYLPQRSKLVSFRARQVFQKQYISPWNWAIFYVDPLEIHPALPFTINGWVQTNSDLYTGHNLLTFNNKVTYGNNWYIGFMPGDVAHSSDTPASPNYPSDLPPEQGAQQQPFGMDSSRVFSTSDANDNNDSYHELIEIPDPTQPDPLASQRYYDQAGIKITVDANNNVTMYTTASGTNAISAQSTGSDKLYYTAFTNALTTNQTIQDNREAASVRLVSLDIGVITAAVNAGSLPGFNGIIYIADTSADPNGGLQQRGIRLNDGAVMPNGGLTVASANPVYIQGDYNTGVNPPSDNGDPTQPTAAGYTRQPCAVIADAVDVLSNSWQDQYSGYSIGSRIASNTTVNSALIAGIVPTVNPYYSGGAENFPRFLEYWSNATFTYYGSMVELYASHQAKGIWGQGNIYQPPTRNWNFDSSFTTNPPPGSIMVINYNRAQWWQE